MTKRSASKAPAADQQAPDTLNEIYMAHQVHTLAQILLQQLSQGWSAGNAGAVGAPQGSIGWNPVGGIPAGQQGWQCAPPPIVHWYP
jgi:hypothetical protein